MLIVRVHPDLSGNLVDVLRECIAHYLPFIEESSGTSGFCNLDFSTIAVYFRKVL